MIWTQLTEREKEVLYCLAQGLTTSQAANKLFISHETVKSHRTNLMLKLDASNAFQLGMRLVQYKLLENDLRVAS